jgi:hypothetical protein
MTPAMPTSQNGVSRRLAEILFLGIAFITGAVWWYAHTSNELAKDFIRPSVKTEIVESEALILALTPRLKNVLAKSVLNLTFDEIATDGVFADRVAYNKLEPGSSTKSTQFSQLAIEQSNWTVSRSNSQVASNQIWNNLFDRVEYFDRAKFSIVSAEFASGSGSESEEHRLNTYVSFAGLAADKEHSPIAITATIDLVWQFHGEPASETTDPLKWRITDWTTKSLTMSKSHQTLFAESLDSLVADSALHSRLRNSQHEEFILAKYAALQRFARERKNSDADSAADKAESNWQPPHPLFSVVAQDRHPAVSIVDIDQDGFDDIYVMSRWGRNVLLRNKQDGTFEDIAQEIGLDIDSHCASAVFADIDNDGDPDLVLGRTLQRSQLLINQDGKFVDQSSLFAGDLPYLVSSVSVADYNNDGLLDIFFATYAANLLHDERDAHPNQAGFLSDFLSEDDVESLDKRLNRVTHHRYLDYSGPPNLLLTNIGGGHFEESKLNKNVQGWRHCYQASWNDFDGDGDQDLYLANDFAINQLYRNDGNSFVDVASETNTTDVGFGMGVSWGDYNNDSHPDLYVSNMFSKAGRRITSQLEDIDERFARMAGGNSLFSNAAGAFAKISGTKAPQMLVEKAGWSWGSQFVDVDNDGFLDLYALSGYYTAPASVAVQTDL